METIKFKIIPQDVLPPYENKNIWIFEIDDKIWSKWYNQVIENFMKESWPRFDIDECQECWRISPQHIIELMKFYIDNQKQNGIQENKNELPRWKWKQKR